MDLILKVLQGMEKNDDCTPPPEWGVDDSDPKYVSKLSTILVATIQEAKDRISQIEFLFCSQIYPNFLARSNELRESLEESRKKSEEKWKVNEQDLLTRIQLLEAEKREVSDNCFYMMNEKKQHLKKLEDDNCRLNVELKCLADDKAKALDEKKIADENLRHLEFKLSENQGIQAHREHENIELLNSLRAMEDSSDGFKQELERKERELYEERVLTARLRNEVDMNVDQILKHDVKLKEAEKENALLQDKISVLEKKIASERMSEVKASAKLEAELHAEQKKLMILLESFKKCKSENAYLRKKLNLTEENMISAKNNGIFLKCHQDLPPGDADKTEEAARAPKGTVSSRTSSSEKPSLERVPSLRSKERKRHISSWVNTRSDQSKAKGDPHDDFLDTPLEHIRKQRVEEDAATNHSGDELPEMVVARDDQNPVSKIDQSGKNSFKFIETVKSKAERQKLKGVECKQCRKFYDAVLPDRGDDGNQHLRCEHDEGVSRHRYRYVPPSTPEGFWNIGFDTEM